MNAIEVLAQAGIRPTPQRLAVAEFVLAGRTHPTADGVFAAVQHTCPTISRATVYNTLRLLVNKGLLREQVLREGVTVFDAERTAHHHFVDEETGQIHDVPWEALKVYGADQLGGFEVHDLQVVLRGRRRRA